MADDTSKPDADAERAAADEVPPDEPTVRDATTPVGRASDAEQPPAGDDALPPIDGPGVESLDPNAPAETEEQATPEAVEPPPEPPPGPPAGSEAGGDPATADAGPSPETADAAAAQAGGPAKGGPRERRGAPRDRGRQRPPRDRPRAPREKGPLPFGELRAAAEAVRDIHGARRALRDAFAVLAERERQDLSRLVAEDADWRVRARNIAAGSLGAGRLGKAIAAQQIAMANVDDLWSLTLSKEEAAQRAARVRDAKRRDERRAQRAAERGQRADRVSRAELEKAQDGRVGAQIRIVVAGDKADRKRKGDEDPPDDKPPPGTPGGGGLLDRLGY
jgi:hypothetical protein